jgi:hypothetical protein
MTSFFASAPVIVNSTPSFRIAVPAASLQSVLRRPEKSAIMGCMAALARITATISIVLALGFAAASAAQSYGMKQFVDTKYGFSFWYPASLKVTVTASNDDKSFPGGVLAETVQVGELGGVAVRVVNSPQGAITDEPNGHAAPIPQTELFMDAAMQMWMVRFPEGDGSGKPVEAKGIDLSKKTIGGLPMVATGARFDTTIIPLSKTRFVVVQDGGGSAFTQQLAATVAAAGAKVNASAQARALQALAAASKN